jgi:D-serine deaminase-like pyridoxal phosphate-dependent protein
MVPQQAVWAEIDTPAPLIDVAQLDRNIAAMADAFALGPVSLRPHAKTHKCSAIALRQIAAGAIGITCAKVGEAEALAHPDIDDILIANEIVGPLKIARLVALARRSRITVAVDDAGNVAELSSGAASAGVTIGILVDLDVGMGRAGVATIEAAVALAHRVAGSAGLRFRGLMGYEGHVVDERALVQRHEGTRAALEKLSAARRAVEKSGLTVECLSAGGTGTYAVTSGWPDLTEAQVGSYVFMDANYRAIEGMEAFAPSLTVLATVMSRPTPTTVIVDAGLKAMGSEYAAAELLDFPQAHCIYLSEEHGRFDFPADPGLHLGDKVRVLPPHGCTTSNLHDRYYALREGDVEIWPIEARGRCQ